MFITQPKGCAFVTATTLLLCVAACEKPGANPKKEASSPAGAGKAAEPVAPAARPAQDAHGAADETPTLKAAPADTNAPHDATADGKSLALDGITMTVPAAWVEQPTGGAGSMAPKAVYQIPHPAGDPASVRITHFPGMKGMDDANIQRWLGQVQRTDGSPATRDDGTLTVDLIGDVRVTTLDVTGSIKPTMRDAAKTDQRMIAGIIDHPQGPHFVVVVGDKSLMDAQADTILAFLKSARTGS